MKKILHPISIIYKMTHNRHKDTKKTLNIDTAQIGLQTAH